MRQDAPLPPAQVVALYVRGLRGRARALYATRSFCAALGAGGLSFLAIAAIAGPVVSPRFAFLGFGILGLIVFGVFLAGLLPLRKVRGDDGCRLLAASEPVLASRVRSALELHRTAASQALIEAHAESVRNAIQNVPAAKVVPLSGLKHPMVAGGMLACSLSGVLLASEPGLKSASYGLLHPTSERADGVRIGAVIGGRSAKLLYPSYLSKAPVELKDLTVVRAPRGTTLELLVQPKLRAHVGSVELGQSSLAMSEAPNGRLFARFVVRQSAPLRLRVFDGDAWFEDEQIGRIDVIEDQRPEATLELPEGHTTVEARAAVPLHFKASDDYGLASIDLVVASEASGEQRRRVWSTLHASQPTTLAQDDTNLVPVELGAQPGDVLSVWLEAKDADVVSGPNVGLSKVIKLEVATDAQKLSLRLPMLREVLDGALESLGDRLETAVPEHAAPAAQRMRELHASAATWTADLRRLISSAQRERDAQHLDLDQLQGVLDRTLRELNHETASYRTGAQNHAALVDVDTRVVSEHERDVLLLADMLAQGLVDEARALAKELSDLKMRVGQLLHELKDKQSPEARRALLAEIATIQRRLHELSQSLSRLSNRVPGEFINREALPQDGTTQALEQLRASVETGDLESAEQQLKQLAQGIDDLAQHIESGGARFREAHFGAHDKALSTARRELDMLSAEQGRLAERTNELVRRAAERARSRGDQGVSQDMRKSAEQLEDELRKLAESDPQSPENTLLERARDRMRDVNDALRTGDLASARRMSAQASGNLESVADNLEQDARMFGQRGRAGARASSASASAAKLRKLQQRIEQAMPQLGEFIGDSDRKQMREDFDPQHRARRKAEQLQAEMGNGEDGMPLSPSGDRGLGAATEAMRRAERALEHHDPRSAALAQQDASEQLHQLQQQLERQGGTGQREGDERHGQSGGREVTRNDTSVHIPRADEFSGPVEMRRRLLDAMKESSPPEFRTAVKRYYEELLR